MAAGERSDQRGHALYDLFIDGRDGQLIATAFCMAGPTTDFQMPPRYAQSFTIAVNLPVL